MLAAVALFIGDLGHIHSGMAVYPGEQGPRFGQIPLWVLLEFFLAALLLVATYPFKVRVLKFNDQRPSLKFVLLNLGWTLLIYLGTSLPEEYLSFKIVGLSLMVMGQFFYLKLNDLPSLADLVVVAAFGWTTEYILGQNNIFVYLPKPSLITTLPVWLPLIYASAAMSARLGGRYLSKH